VKYTQKDYLLSLWINLGMNRWNILRKITFYLNTWCSKNRQRVDLS